jgi:hypothetical protein
MASGNFLFIFPNEKVDRYLLLLFFGIAAACFFIPNFDVLVYIYATVLALLSPRRAIEATLLTFFLVLGNPAIINPTTKALRWVVVAAVIAQAIISLSQRKERTKELWGPAMVLLGFMVIMIPLNLINSLIPSISIFKILSFGLGAMSLLICFQYAAKEQDELNRYFHTFFVFIWLLSVVIFFGGYGYVKNEAGFQGALSHPQILGPIGAIISAYFLGQGFYNERYSNFHLIAGLSFFLFVLMSQARTGVFMLGGGFILMTLTGPNALKLPQKIFRLAAVGVVVLLITTAAGIFNVFAFTADFVAKDEEDAGKSVGEIFDSSRGAHIERSMANFAENKLLGIGFGVPSDQEYTEEIEYFYGFPISARLEKGFTPTATLEENGVLGTFIIVILLLTIIAYVINVKDRILRWILFTALLVNVGEAVFFSFGGAGMFIWIMIGFTLAISGRKSQALKTD